MSADITDTPTARTSATGGFVAFVADQRMSVAWILVALGVASFAAGIFCGYKFLNPPGATETKADPDANDPEATVKLTPPRQPEYAAGALVGLIGTIAGIGVGGWLLAGQLTLDRADQLREARVAILLAGGLFGLAFMALGSVLFYLWFDSLLKWIDAGTASGAKYPLLALLIFLFGAGLMFLGAQPARAEERNNPLLRRLVYGTNLALTTVLLVMLLLVGNVVAALRLPARLDTTEGGVHTLALSEPTREYIAGLDKTLQIYAILAEGADPVSLDTRRMLEAAQEANPERIEVRYLTETLNTKEINELQNQFPQVQLGYGILMTVRGSDKQVAFLSRRDMIKAEPVPGTGEQRTVFQGESQFARELLALTEAKSQPVVYFTQSNGELNVVTGGGPDAMNSGRPASELRKAIESINCKVEALKFDADITNPTIPENASLVAVCDPVSTLSDSTVSAIRRYMTEPRGPDGKGRGKLLVLAGAHPKPGGGAGIMATGLEPLLAELSINLQPKVLYASPLEQIQASELTPRLYSPRVAERNPIALAFNRMPILAKNVRPCEPVDATRPGGPRAEILLVDLSGRATWLENDILPNPDRTWNEMITNRSREVAQAKNLGIGLRSVASIASDDTGARVVAFGFGDYFSDDTSRMFRGQPYQADLFSASVNWLRDRPAVANIPAKVYGEYTLDRDSDFTKLFWLPFGLCVLSIAAVGLGVLVLRRS